MWLTRLILLVVKTKREEQLDINEKPKLISRNNNITNSGRNCPN